MSTAPARVAVEVDVKPDVQYSLPITLRFRTRAAIREHVANCMALIGALPDDGEAEGEAEDEALPDCATPGCGHPEALHHNEQGGPIATGPCTQCRECGAYALPVTDDAETGAAR
jgi:hypothetical protein